MKPYFLRISGIGKFLFPEILWNKKSKEKIIYLTFDDGPIPIVTPWVLEQLKTFNAKATFFCIAENVETNTEIFKEIVNQGHSIGNHTYNHINGWKTTTSTYLLNIAKANEVLDLNLKSIESNKPCGSKQFQKKLFRPPYGKVTLQQYFKIKKEGYQTVMWDVISGDFDKNLSPKESLDYVLKYAKSGSIIVMHDSLKAFETLKEILPEILMKLKEEGYVFKSL